MKARYFYSSLVSFLGGVAIQTVYDLSLPTITWVIFVGGALFVASSKKGGEVRPHIGLLVCILTCFSLGLLRFEVASWSFGHSTLTAKLGASVVLEGVVIREPEQRASSRQLVVDSGGDSILVTTDVSSNVLYGDTVVVQGVLAKPEPFATELGREFDYPSYLLVRNIEYVVRFADVTVVQSGMGNPFISFLLKQKASVINGIESVLPPPESGLGLGLLLGVKQALGDDLESAFRTSGLTHIIVLSGYNVMLVVTFVMFCLSLMFPRRLRLVTGLVAIACFALLVGLSATVVRASIMAALVLIAQLFHRTYDLMRALLFAGVVMVIINPYLLVYDIGFQLSFMATLGLILIAPKLESFMYEGLSNLTIKDFFISTLATQIAVLPLLLYYIGEMSLVAIVVNVLVLPVVPLAMLSTFVSGVVALVFEPLARFISFVAYLSLTYIIHVAEFFSALPFASITVPSFSGWWVFGMYALCGYLFFVYHRTEKQNNELAGWVIEEEKVGEAQSASPTTPQTPVFFR